MFIRPGGGIFRGMEVDMKMPVQGFGDGVVSPFVPGGTTGDAFHSQPAASDHPKSFNGLIGVVGTGGRVDAVASQNRGDEDLVEANELQEDEFRKAG